MTKILNTKRQAKQIRDGTAIGCGDCGTHFADFREMAPPTSTSSGVYGIEISSGWEEARPRVWVLNRTNNKHHFKAQLLATGSAQFASARVGEIALRNLQQGGESKRSNRFRRPFEETRKEIVGFSQNPITFVCYRCQYGTENEVTAEILESAKKS